MSEINHRYLMDKEGENFFPITHTDAVIGLEDIDFNQTVKSNLGNKTIVMFGDSITELGDYPQSIANSTGANIIDLGIANGRMAKHSTGELGQLLDKQCMHRMVDYIKNNDYTELIKAVEDMKNLNGDDNTRQANEMKSINWSEVDYITIFLGTNDYGGDNPIGTNNDYDGNTFKGAINKVIKTFGEYVPTARLVFLTPIFRNRYKANYGANSDVTKNDAGFYLQNYVEAIQEIANNNHIPVIDLMSLSGINKYNCNVYLSDDLHPTQLGYDLLAKLIQRQLELI